MRAEAATGMTERSEREFSGQLEEASGLSTLTLTLTLTLTPTQTLTLPLGLYPGHR